MADPNCIFCAIVAGASPASVIYQDKAVLAFMNIRPIRPGQCMVIPKAHVDHFTDVDDDLAQRIMVVAQHIGRRMHEVFQPQRVGMVVHGFGVPHAHLLLIPQHAPDDITSGRFAVYQDGTIEFRIDHIPLAERPILDEHARLLAIQPPPTNGRTPDE